MLLRIKYIAAILQIIFTRIRIPMFDIIKFSAIEYKNLYIN
jgi:hypothetical protein